MNRASETTSEFKAIRTQAKTLLQERLDTGHMPAGIGQDGTAGGIHAWN